jgi:hypothetical protein
VISEIRDAGRIVDDMPTNTLSKLSVLALALAACTTNGGGGGNSSVTRQRATSVYSAASTRLETALKATSQHASLTGNIDVSSPCATSGDIALLGTYDSVAGFDMTASFSACQESEGRLDGELHWLEKTDAAGITDTWTGTLDFVDADGTWSCTFDYHSIVSATSVRLSGTICGYDVANDLDL